MSWSIVGTVAAGVVGGVITNQINKSTDSGGGGAAASAADPFATQRPQYQQMLQQLMTNPSSYQQSAASKNATQAGMGAIDANMAAKGLGNSGAQEMALTKYATDMAGNDYQTQMSNLMQLSGATGGSPATAGQIIGQQQGQNAAAIGTLSGAVGNAFAGYMNQPSAGGNWNSDMGGTPAFGGNTNFGGGSNFGSDTGSMPNYLTTGF